MVVAWMALHLTFGNLVLQPGSSWPDEQERERECEGSLGLRATSNGAVALAIDASKASSIARLFWWIGASPPLCMVPPTRAACRSAYWVCTY
mgnify:CR=1 FL=1